MGITHVLVNSSLSPHLRIWIMMVGHWVSYVGVGNDGGASILSKLGLGNNGGASGKLGLGSDGGTSG